MTAPRTRLTEAANAFEREILGSWEHERPSSGARRSTLGLLGGGAALGATSTAATSAAASLGGAAPAAGAGMAASSKVAAVGAMAIAKWVAAGTVVTLGALTVAPYVRGPSAALRTARPPVAPAGGPTVAAPGSEVRRETTPALPAPQAREARDEGAPAEPTAQVVVASAARVPAAFPPDGAAPLGAAGEARISRGLGDQVALIDRARTSLAAGDAAAALRVVDDYDARFPRGSLSQEATVFRVEALVKLHQRDRAAEVADRFLAAHPASPHASKVKELLRP